ncbi:hypothetical protein ACROYT_G014813 [Oculina patagonica]
MALDSRRGSGVFSEGWSRFGAVNRDTVAVGGSENVRLSKNDFSFIKAASKPSAMALRLADMLFPKATLVHSTVHRTKDFDPLDPTRISAIKAEVIKPFFPPVQKRRRHNKDVGGIQNKHWQEVPSLTKMVLVSNNNEKEKISTLSEEELALLRSKTRDQNSSKSTKLSRTFEVKFSGCTVENEMGIICGMCKTTVNLNCIYYDDYFEKQRKIRVELWDSVGKEVVEHLPDDIDEDKVYKIKDQLDREKLVAALEDGRKWKKNCPTTWSLHARVRYADCKGSFKCTRNDCPFKVQYGVINTTQTEKKKTSGEFHCKGCRLMAEFVPCSACRYISHGKKSAKVYHCGQHTCPVIKAQVENTDQAHQILKDNPNIKPAKLQSACILSTICQQCGWLDIEKQAEATGSWVELNITMKYFKNHAYPNPGISTIYVHNQTFLLSEKIKMQTCLNSGLAESRKQQG